MRRFSGGSGISLNSLNYNRTAAELVVDLRADSLDLYEPLRNGFVAQGLDAQLVFGGEKKPGKIRRAIKRSFQEG